MKNTQRGFTIPLVIVVIALAVVGGGVYVYKNKKVNVQVATTDTNITLPSEKTQPTNIQNNIASTSSTTPSSVTTQKNTNDIVKSEIKVKSTTYHFKDEKIGLSMDIPNNFKTKIDDSNPGFHNVVLEDINDPKESKDIGFDIISGSPEKGITAYQDTFHVTPTNEDLFNLSLENEKKTVGSSFVIDTVQKVNINGKEVFEFTAHYISNATGLQVVERDDMFFTKDLVISVYVNSYKDAWEKNKTALLTAIGSIKFNE